MPTLGYGTWFVEGGENVENGIKRALNVGYTHIDTATFYNNEKDIGNALKKLKVNREDVFITTKL